jgi:hypothetical protein
MANKKFRSFLVIAAALVAGGMTSASPALANDTGQCNGPNHAVVHKPEQLEANLKAEGPKALKAMKVLARRLGWAQRDGSFRMWLKHRTIIVRTQKQVRIRDYFCRGGTMKFWKVKTEPAGTPMIVVLPNDVRKGDVSTHRRKGFHSESPSLKSLALALCSNGALAKFVQQIFVRRNEEKPPPKKAKPKPKPQTQSGECSGNNNGSGSTGSVTGNCNKVGDCNGAFNCNVVIVTPPCDTCNQPPPPTLTVSCLTHHDVFSGGQIDLEIQASFADGTQPVLTPDDVQFWVDENNMMDGTKHTYTDSSGTYWVQRWQAPATTLTHVVTWHASVRGAIAPCSNDNNVVADGGW